MNWMFEITLFLNKTNEKKDNANQWQNLAVSKIMECHSYDKTIKIANWKRKEFKWASLTI